MYKFGWKKGKKKKVYFIFKREMRRWIFAYHACLHVCMHANKKNGKKKKVVCIFLAFSRNNFMVYSWTRSRSSIHTDRYRQVVEKGDNMAVSCWYLSLFGDVLVMLLVLLCAAFSPFALLLVFFVGLFKYMYSDRSVCNSYVH